MENPAVKIIKKDKKNFEPIAQILKRLIKGNGAFYEELKLLKLQEHWPEIAGPLQQYAEITGYKNNTLYLDAASSSWAQQLVFYKQTIIEKYSAACSLKITDVRVSSTGKINLVKREEEFESTEEALLNKEDLFEEIQDEKIAGRLKEIFNKAQKIHKKDRRKHCVVCGLKQEGNRLICFKCHDKKLTLSKNIIREYLLEAPWSRYSDINKDLPGISEEEYHAVKEQLIRQRADELTKFRFNQKNSSTKAKKQFQETALFYTMLRTGLTPDKINDIILKEHMGDKVYNALSSQH